MSIIAVQSLVMTKSVISGVHDVFVGGRRYPDHSFSVFESFITVASDLKS